MVARAKTDSTITTDEKIYNKASLCAVGQRTRSPLIGACDRNADCPGSVGANRIHRMGDVRNVFYKISKYFNKKPHESRKIRLHPKTTVFFSKIFFIFLNKEKSNKKQTKNYYNIVD